MNLGSLIGVGGAMGMIVFSILFSGNTMGSFIDIPSLALVVVGSYFALMTASSLSDAIGVFSTIKLTFKTPVFNQQAIIQKMMAFSEKARREGLLALEDELEDLDDEFMKKGLRLMVDGTDATIIRDLMELELSQMQNRHATKNNIVTMWGALSPGLGMLGTVMGLIGMLKNLDDKASIGPNMALALVTTFYGSMVANLLMIPFVSKLKVYDGLESNMREMIIEGVLSIQAGENTRILALKLMAYLDPVSRRALESEMLKD
ncbi:MAG: MotA/TolQ/ExbB proton channel family protein [Treponema sp.]|jgi:chemotaxis protein MotA|nr:MotA/TolQ/ExbB proton channel family protein [Treponema sp.]